MTRNDREVAATYPTWVRFAGWDAPMVLDGEIVALDERGAHRVERCWWPRCSTGPGPRTAGLADAVGMHPNAATQWARLANSAWASYLAAAPAETPPPRCQ